MHRKGQLPTAEQVIFALMFVMLILGILTAKFAFDMQGGMQADIQATITASAIDALSGMEKGEITMPFSKPWDVALGRDRIVFESEGRRGESGILGNVKESSVSGAKEILITKEMNSPVELKAGE